MAERTLKQKQILALARARVRLEEEQAAAQAVPVAAQAVPVPFHADRAWFFADLPRDPYVNTRGGYQMAGSLAGGLLGTPLGPFGALGGAALGATAGDQIQDLVGDLFQTAGVGPELPSRTIDQRATGAVDAATLDAAFGGAAAAVRPVWMGAKNLASRAFGVGAAEKAAGRQAAMVGIDPDIPRAFDAGRAQPEPGTAAKIYDSRMAKELAGEIIPNPGIAPSITSMSSFPVVQGAAKIIGKFPFIGSPFTRQFGKAKYDVDAFAENTFARLGPVSAITDLSEDVVNIAQKRFKVFKNAVNRKYKIAKDLAELSNAQFDAAPIVNLARKIGTAARSDAPQMVATKTVEQKLPSMARPITRTVKETKPLPTRQSAEADFLDFVGDLQQLTPTQTITQLDTLAARLDDIASSGRKAGLNKTVFLPATQLKKALEQSLRTSGDPKLTAAFNDADDFFTRTLSTKFETATAKKFGRVDKRMFSVGIDEPGSLTSDQILDVVMSTKSPQALSQLRRLLGARGKAIFRRAVARDVDDAFGIAMKDVEKNGFNKDGFLKRLGLSNPKSAEYQATLERVKGLRLNVDQIRKFAVIAEKALPEGMPNISTFVARRGTLGGFRSVIGALLPVAASGGAGAVAGIGVTSAIFGSFVARYGADLLSRPRILKSLEDIYRYRNQPKLLRGAVARMWPKLPDADYPDEMTRSDDQGRVRYNQVSAPISR